MGKAGSLPISIGILAWRSGKTLARTLRSYEKNGLFEMVSDTTVLFQEASAADYRLAQRFGIPCIGLGTNVGIGRGFSMLAENGREETVLLLEHDWRLIECELVTRQRLEASLQMLERGYDCVRLRHRRKYGFPHFTIDRYRGAELAFYDEWMKLRHPHLLNSVHWKESPHEEWPEKIQRDGDFFVSTSRYANWTNNPCLFRRQFYLDTVEPFVGDGIMLEQNISYWWSRQGRHVAQGEGLFEHCDPERYGHPIARAIKSAMRRLWVRC